MNWPSCDSPTRPDTQVYVTPYQWSFPLNLPIQFFGIFPEGELGLTEEGMPWEDEIEQRMLLPPSIGEANSNPGTLQQGQGRRCLAALRIQFLMMERHCPIHWRMVAWSMYQLGAAEQTSVPPRGMADANALTQPVAHPHACVGIGDYARQGECAFFHKSTRTLLVTDAVMYLSDDVPDIIPKQALLESARDSWLNRFRAGNRWVAQGIVMGGAGRCGGLGKRQEGAVYTADH